MLAETRTEICIRPVSFTAILDAPNADKLLKAYAEECLVSDAIPQRSIYEAMEKAGVLHCFAAYASDDTLIGFVSVLTAVMPHTGRLQATGESVFVAQDYRDTGAGILLIEAIEKYTDSIRAVLSWLPRVGSALDKILSRRSGYSLTHSQHTRYPA